MNKVIIYGTTISNAYAQIVEVTTEKVWDVQAGALAAAPTYADTKITMTQNVYHGGYPITIPPTLPAGEFDLLVKDGANPAYTDAVAVGKRFQWDGELLGLPLAL